MALHHIALATNNTEATHTFYTDVMGFRLAKVVAGATRDGWSKHLFYDTGDGGFIAFWEMHDKSIPEAPSAISTAIGLPIWVNHLAFGCPTLAQLHQHRERWLAHGLTVTEVDHDWCQSIYTVDPNGILVEMCTMIRSLDESDANEALQLLADANPPIEPPLRPQVHQPA
jgi:catechol 2,3-dioxygenase-like lactoylglutathione lyase family enzyme